MHKCFNCGTQFDGKYCPECGAAWVEEKTCPQCGAKLSGEVKFCNECGYSFVTAKTSAKSSAFKQKLFNALTWVKNHIKIVVPVAISLIAVIVVLALIPTFILSSVNGTYYLCRNGVFSEDDYIVLSAGKWTDDDGLSGTYKLSGNKITLVYRDAEMEEFFGEDATETMVGTIESKVLSIKDDMVTTRYCMKSHTHKFGKPETFIKPTCVDEGSSRMICDCGYMEISAVPATGEHTVVGGICSICNQSQLIYELNGDGQSYAVTGINQGFEYIETVEISDTYNNLPVTTVKKGAFADNEKLIRVKIGEKVVSIQAGAFSGCTNLANVEIANQHWRVSLSETDKVGEKLDVTDSAITAGNLKEKYSNYYWREGQWTLSMEFDEFVAKMEKGRNYTCIITENSQTFKYDFDGDNVRLRENGERYGCYWMLEGETFYQYKWNPDDSKYHKTISEPVVANEIILNKLLDAIVTDYDKVTKEYTVTIDEEEYLMKVDDEMTIYNKDSSVTYYIEDVGTTILYTPRGNFVIDDTAK